MNSHVAGSELIDRLRDGEMDDRLDEIIEAIRLRRNYLDALAATKLKVGSRVINKEAWGRRVPAFQLATVVGFTRNGSVKIEFDDGYGRERGRTGVWTCPASQLLEAHER